MTQIPSSIKDNHERGSVGSFLREQIDVGSRLSVVSAYFTIYAYHHLKDKLDIAESLDFLFGEPAFINTLDPSKTDKKEFQIEDDQLVIPLHNRLGQKSVAKECSDWIKARVSIKSVVKPNFLHGKMYHIRSNGVQKAMIGSSNFTVRGLGLSQNPNIELNMEATDDRDKTDLLNWFREIWEDAALVKDVKDDVLRYLEQLYAENDPEFIYFKTLYHLFEDFLSEQQRGGLLDEKTGFFDTNIWNMLYAFQKDAVKGAINKILRHDGCVLADSVGLGKTFEALAVIKYFELLNNKVLVLCPKKLSDNWTMYQAQNNSLLNPLVDDRLGYTVLCHTDLSRESGRSVSSIELSLINWGNYDLVVIDESHNFRNNAKGQRDEEGNIIRKSRYEKLMSDIINAGVRTKVLLLSATPVNNDLKDLRNQLYFISGGKDDSFYEKTGVKNLAHTMKEAQKVFTRWADPEKNQARNVKRLLDKLDSSFFKLLDELTIARSRKHIQTYYKDEVKRIGAFPIRLPVISKAPDIDIKDEFPAYDRINREMMTYKLSLFNPWAYVRDEWKSFYEEKAGRAITAFSQERREHYLIGMMKVNFLKRLESSIASFEISMERTIEKITGLQERIREYKTTSGSSEIGSPEIYDEDDTDLNDANSIGKKLRYHLEHLDLDKWLRDLKSDKDALVLLRNTAKAVTPDRDKKLAVLKSLIREKIRNPINAENKKVIVFTAFTDTANYLYENLFQFVREALNLHIALVSGSGTNKTTLGKTRFEHILTNFSPISKNRDKIKEMPRDEEISVLIATDCISEGQNLQDCDYLINYDIHWNPVRIIQRFGRIDRLGSKNEKIQLVNFWPTDDLNNYINLKDRVEARMALVDIAATGQDNLLEAEQIKYLIEDDLSFRSRQLKRLKKEVLDLEELDENVSLSEFTLDDFRVELANYIEKNREKLQKAPLGLYAVVPSPESEHFKPSRVGKISESAREIIRPGVIFCLRQKGDTQGNESVNPLSPYFLVYVRRDGTVRFNYTHAKQILEIFRLLGNGVEKPYDILCDLFNKETKNGSEMRNYNMLLSRAISEIRSVFRKKANIRLTQSRGARLIPKKKQAEKSGQFELISWLVIK